MKASHIKFLIALIAFCLAPRYAPSQAISTADRVRTARALYYTPTASGLRSFGCSVTLDWKGFIEKASGQDIGDDNPMLMYLNSAQLSVKDDLGGAGRLEWANTTTPPQALEDPAAKVQAGLKQMFSGFFQSWNAYLNGNMFPVPDALSTLTPVGGGVHLHAAAEKTTVDEDFDKTMLLTKAHVVKDATDVIAMPIFVDTDDGRLISEIHNEVRMTQDAPPMFVDIFVSYQPVADYQLPSDIRYNVKNVLDISFKLMNCTTTSQASVAAPYTRSPK